MPTKTIIRKVTLWVLLALLNGWVTTRYPDSGWLPVILVLNIFILSSLWQKVFAIIFGMSSKALRVRILAAAWGFAVWMYLAGWAIVFQLFNGYTLAVALFIEGMLLMALGIWQGSRSTALESEEKPQDVWVEEPKAKVGVLLFIISIFIAAQGLFSRLSDAVVLSPWQVVTGDYFWWFFAAAFILGLLVFSRISSRLAILFLVLLYFISLSYLPATHQYFYGADQWRHVGTEMSVLQTGGQREVTTVDVATVDWGKLSYAQFWAAGTTLKTYVPNWNLIDVNKWLLPILWSLIFPVLLYELARAFNGTKPQALLLAWLGLIPFALQAAGAFSLPNNFGLWQFILLVVLLIRTIRRPGVGQLPVLFGSGILLLTGYIVYFIIYWFVLLLAISLKRLTNLADRMRIWACVLAVIILSICLPAVEVLFGYSGISKDIPLVSNLTQMVGNVTGYYLANGPRPHDIAAGNILFNQTPLSAFVSNAFTVWRFWLIPVAIAFWCLAWFGFVKLIQSKDIGKNLLGVLGVGLMCGYAISWYALTGEHLLVRRLDGVIAFLCIFAVFFAGVKMANWREGSVPYGRRFGLVLLLTIIMTASYSLGPDTRTMSQGEYQAAAYVWQLDSNNAKHCVIGDTYPLLALEAISARKVVGGGLPISTSFSEAVNNSLARRLAYDDLSAADEAKQITGADTCWLITDQTLSFQKQIFQWEKIKVYKF